MHLVSPCDEPADTPAVLDELADSSLRGPNIISATQPVARRGLPCALFSLLRKLAYVFSSGKA